MHVRRVLFKFIAMYCNLVTQIALAIGVLTLSKGVRVRKFCGFVLRGEGCRAGCRSLSDVYG